nr:hypothetical protein [Tanacetum cinerariifolium]
MGGGRSKPSEGHTGWYTEKHIDNTVVNFGVSGDNDGPERTPRSMPENIPLLVENKNAHGSSELVGGISWNVRRIGDDA